MQFGSSWILASFLVVDIFPYVAHVVSVGHYPAFRVFSNSSSDTFRRFYAEKYSLSFPLRFIP